MRQLKTLWYYSYSILEMVVHFRNWPRIFPLFLSRFFDQKTLLASNVRLKLRRPPIEFFVRSAMDVWSVKETFIDQFYVRFGTPVEDNWTVIDIGAGIGDFCIFAAFDKPGVVVYAFEPYPGSFTLLQKNLVLNDVENVKAFQKAVWSKVDELHLDFSEGEPLQISSREDISCLGRQIPVKVEGASLVSVMAEEQIDQVDLLKLDCEGAEYEILLKTSPEILHRIKRIIMEYHEIDPVHTHQVLVSFLGTQGYRVTCHPNTVHDNIGYLFATRL